MAPGPQAPPQAPQVAPVAPVSAPPPPVTQAVAQAVAQAPQAPTPVEPVVEGSTALPVSVAPPAAPPAAAPTMNEDALITSLQQAHRLKDVLNVLEDNGVKGADALVAACSKYAPHVPLLQRIGNMDERVRRAYEALAH